MKDFMYFIHQEVELVDLGTEEQTTQLLSETNHWGFNILWKRNINSIKLRKH